MSILATQEKPQANLGTVFCAWLTHSKVIYIGSREMPQNIYQLFLPPATINAC